MCEQAGVRNRLGPLHKLTQISVLKLSRLYRAWGKPDKAANLETLRRVSRR